MNYRSSRSVAEFFLCVVYVFLGFSFALLFLFLSLVANLLASVLAAFLDLFASFFYTLFDFFAGVFYALLGLEPPLLCLALLLGESDSWCKNGKCEDCSYKND